MNLTEQTCVACEGGVNPFSLHEAEILIKQIPEWKIKLNGTWITRLYVFVNFKEALAFVNAVGVLAESEGHHPDIHLINYKQVQIDLSTHAIGGLSNNDFIMAAKIDTLI